ncbi:MAG: YSC84-related protein [Desulfobacterales bacterium]|jgi:lipid-binding SYLF domain-containing protein
MERTVYISKRRYGFYWFSVVLVAFFFSIIIAHPSYGAEESKSAKIDAKVNEALKRFYEQVEDGKEIAKRAKGLLILPNVGKGALIVGFEYGRGALRVGGKTVDYYSMAAGSLGFQIGGEAKDIIITFNNDDALKGFRAAKGWEAGVDGNVALFTVGGGQKSLSAMNENPILAFIFDVKGLIADISIKGAKFNKLNLSE